MRRAPRALRARPWAADGVLEGQGRRMQHHQGCPPSPDRNRSPHGPGRHPALQRRSHTSVLTAPPALLLSEQGATWWLLLSYSVPLSAHHVLWGPVPWRVPSGQGKASTQGCTDEPAQGLCGPAPGAGPQPSPHTRRGIQQSGPQGFASTTHPSPALTQ